MTLTPASLVGCDSPTAFQNAVERDAEAVFSHYQALVQAIRDMRTAGSTLQTTVLEQASEIEALKAKNDVLTNEVSTCQNMCNKLRGANEAMLAIIGNHQAAPRLSPKHPDPEMFSGKRSDLVRFTTQMKVKLHQNKDHFTAPKSDIFYSISRLEGDAMAQVQPLIKSESEIDLKSMTELFDLLQLAFGDPDKKGTAQRAIRNLRQTNREFHEYLADFQRYIPDTNYDEEAKLAALIEGLSTELKSMLQFVATPTSFSEAIKTLQDLENKRKMYGVTNNRNTARTAPLTTSNLASRSYTSYSRPTSTAPSTVFTHPSGSSVSPQSSISDVPQYDPMDLSSSRPRGPLSATEKERRTRLGLCLYCGEEGHLARNCPRSNKKRSQLNEVSTEIALPTPQESGNA
jgi:FtsZ-binding cell division protein ZapB